MTASCSGRPAGFPALALAVRAVTAGTLNSAGAPEHYSGTARYGSMAYVGLLFIRPRLRPLPRSETVRSAMGLGLAYGCGLNPAAGRPPTLPVGGRPVWWAQQGGT